MTNFSSLHLMTKFPSEWPRPLSKNGQHLYHRRLRHCQCQTMRTRPLHRIRWPCDVVSLPCAGKAPSALWSWLKDGTTVTFVAVSEITKSNNKELLLCSVHFAILKCISVGFQTLPAACLLSSQWSKNISFFPIKLPRFAKRLTPPLHPPPRLEEFRSALSALLCYCITLKESSVCKQIETRRFHMTTMHCDLLQTFDDSFCTVNNAEFRIFKGDKKNSLLLQKWDSFGGTFQTLWTQFFLATYFSLQMAHF